MIEPVALLMATSMLVQLIACVLPLCDGFGRRGRTVPRTLLALLVFYAGELAQEPLRQSAIAGAMHMPALMLSFGVTMLEAFACLLIVFDASRWQALFCCTAGYIGQNLISGTANLWDTLAGAGLLPALPWPFSVLIGAIIVYPLYLAFFVRPVRRHGLAGISEPQIVTVALVVVATVIGLDVAVKTVGAGAVGLEAYLMARLAHGVLCAFTLFAEQKILAVRQIATEREVERRMAAERERQYELSRKNIDAINVKCHDLRHQIRSLADGGRVADEQALADLANEVSIYDSAVKTANPALDTILTEKGLVCQGEKITLTAIADGRALAGLEPQEIYSLFGNALDNAIEAVRGIGEPERRLISLNVHSAAGRCVINIENSCDATPRFEDGLPISTKDDTANHGFGTRSMRAIVERHGGVLTMGCDNGIFHVDALIPLSS